jgi:hypothetical protein
VRTLICGEDAVLVVVVNENYRCDSEGFFPTPARDVTFTFSKLPWLSPRNVQRATPAGRLVQVPRRVRRREVSWDVEAIEDVAIFRVSSR